MRWCCVMQEIIYCHVHGPRFTWWCYVWLCHGAEIKMGQLHERNLRHNTIFLTLLCVVLVWRFGKLTLANVHMEEFISWFGRVYTFISSKYGFSHFNIRNLSNVPLLTRLNICPCSNASAKISLWCFTWQHLCVEMPIIIAGVASVLLGLCVYEINVHFNADFRGGNISVSWKLKSSADPLIWDYTSPLPVFRAHCPFENGAWF